MPFLGGEGPVEGIAMTMFLGIQKRQWVFLLFALLLPLLLNAAAMWRDISTTTMVQMWNGSYPDPFTGFLGGPYNPLPGIFLKLFLYTAGLGLLIWLMIFISNKTFFRKQSLAARIGETALVVLLITAVTTFVSGFVLPLVWLPKLHDFLLGLPGSSFAVVWSLWLIAPATAAGMSVVMMFSITSRKA